MNDHENTASPVSGDQLAVSSRVSSQGEPGLHDAMRAVLAALNPTGPDPVWPTKSTEFAGYLVEQVEQAFIGAGWRRPRPDHEAALAALRTKLAEEPESILFAGPQCDMEAYAALPPCTACEGGGQDTHGTVFEAPLAVHFAGPPVKAERRVRQLCMWCGHVLIDVALTRDTEPPEWPTGALVRVEDGLATVVPYEPGDPLPPGCCALPDDGEPAPGPGCYPPVDGWDGVSIAVEPEHCGKHVPGTSSNRCLLRPGHSGDCSDEFETPDDEPARAYLDDAEHDDIWPRWCKFVFLGKRCTFAPGHQELWHRLPDGTEVNNEGEPMAGEAQETRAADWPAEETDHG